MNIYFAAAMTGGRQEQPNYTKTVELLRSYGTVLNPYIADEVITNFGETDLSKEEILERELDHLQNCELVVADVTTPSLGVGFTIAKALELEKRVVCLYRGDHTHKLSGMIQGNKKVEVLTYASPDELDLLIDKALQ